MRINRRQLLTALSALYLTLLTALAAVALRNSHTSSLPIPSLFPALTVGLPYLTGILLQLVLSLNESLAAKGHLQTSRAFQVVLVASVVLDAVLATLAGVFLAPPQGAGVQCALRDRWQSLYRAKDAETIRRIQDAFQCCGLGSMRDMAWPFPDKRHGADACVVRYEERTQSCLALWRGEERRVVGMLLGVVIGVFIWKVAVILAPSSGSAWLPSAIRLPQDDEGSTGSTRKRPAIRYRDDVEDDEDVRAEVDRLNNDSTLASTVEASRSRGSGPYREHERWRENGGEA